jgi:AcrR family transcriptional regulator
MPTTASSSAGAPDRPLRRDAERNRARLLEAARVLFAERGLNVTMDDIAAAAGVGVGTAYRRFGSRDHLIAALFDDRLRDYLALAEEALAKPDPWDSLVSFLEQTMAAQAADRGLHDVLMSNPEALQRAEEVRGELLSKLDEVMRRAQEAGAMRPDVTVTDMPIINLMLRQVVDFTDDIAPDAWRRYMTVLLDGLRASRSAPTPLAPPPLEPEQFERAMACYESPRR